MAGERKAKVHALADLEGLLEEARRADRRIVLCHGVFDLMHAGHVLHFKAARRHGDLLVVTVTPDRFVGKGPGRPVFNQRLRVETIAALECVDYVALNEWPSAVETIRRLRPHVYAKGREYADRAADVTGKILAEEAEVRAHGGEILFTDEETFRSSTLINRFFPSYPTPTESYLRRFRERHSSGEVLGALDSLADLRVLIIGEAIIDEYAYCLPLGKAPKETIIASKFVSQERFAGGSLAIANHVAGFCRQATLVTYMADDAADQAFVRGVIRPNVDVATIAVPGRPTVRKRRYVEPTFVTKMFEVQYLDDTPLPREAEDDVQAILAREVPRHDLVVVADFGHGLMTDRLRAFLTSTPAFLAVNTQTNSANLGFNPVSKYRRADYVCLHEGELKLALRTQYGDLAQLGARLREELKAWRVMVTRGPNGALLFSDDATVHESPALAMRTVDRTGAGDAVFAITAPCAYRGCAPEILGFIANCVGALAVEIVGNCEPIDPIALKKFITHLLA